MLHGRLDNATLRDGPARAGLAERAQHGSAQGESQPPAASSGSRRDRDVTCLQASSERIGEIAFAAGVPVHELVTDSGVLEDIFLELTAEAA